MKTRKTRKTRETGETLAAKRSLAAHKANWTRQAGRNLAGATTAAIEAELITRAIERTDKAIVQMTAAIDAMWTKQLGRKAELVRLADRAAAEKEIHATVRRMKGGAS